MYRLGVLRLDRRAQLSFSPAAEYVYLCESSGCEFCIPN